MANAVALASVVTSALVAICVPLLTGRIERITASARLRIARLDELLSIADAASVALAGAERAIGKADVAVESACKETATRRDHAAAETALTDARTSIEATQEALHRTAVRIGWESPVARLYAAAHADLQAHVTLLADVREGGPSSDDVPGWAEVARLLGQIRARYEEDRTLFYAATVRLVNADSP